MRSQFRMLFALCALLLTVPISNAQDDSASPLLPINPDETLTFSFGPHPSSGELHLYIQPEYANLEITPGPYAWILPVPAGSAVVDNYNGTGGRTFRQAVGPPNPCDNMYTYGFGHGDGYGVVETTTEAVIPAVEIFDWAATNNVDLGASLEAVERYAADGYAFAAVIYDMPDWEYYEDRLFGDGPVLEPIAVRWNEPADAITVPVGLFSTRVDRPLPITINLNGDVPYRIDDLERVQIDEDTFDDWLSIHTLAGPINAPLGGPFLSPGALRRANQAALTENTFFTEFSFPPRYDRDNQPGSTRLNALTSTDFTLVTAPDEAYRDDVDLTDRDPLLLYDCSTATLEGRPEIAEFIAALEAAPDDLLDNRTHLRDREYATTVIHPVDWVHTPLVFEHDDIDGVRARLHVFAPEAVTVETLQAYAAGEPTPPMFVVMHTMELFVRSENLADIHSALRETAYAERMVRTPDISGNRPNVVYEDLAVGVRMFALTDEADYNANETMYEAMFAYPQTYHYTLHPDLRHSLYLSQFYTGDEAPTAFQGLQVGFPAGYTPALTAPDTITFSAESDDPIQVSIYDMDALNNLPGTGDEQSFMASVVNTFDLTDEGEQILEDYQWVIGGEPVEKTRWCTLVTDLAPLPFANDSERGYVVFRNGAISISTGVDSAVDDATLAVMADTVAQMPTFICP